MEIIARAVAINDGRMPATRQRNKPWYFLPGGHVEPGEAIQAALARELVEELSAEAQIGRLIGVVEHAYAEDGTDHHELNSELLTSSSDTNLLPMAVWFGM